MMKTIRLRSNGMPKESMSFKNIDYQEVYDNDNWLESEAYEIFTNRFLFVIFKPKPAETIVIHNNKTNKDVTEQSYVLDRGFSGQCPRNAWIWPENTGNTYEPIYWPIESN